MAFNAGVELSWGAVGDAAGYWLEVAHDPGFRRMLQSRWGLGDLQYDPGALNIGTYYWRVAALDKFGLPGERTDAWRFHVQTDVTPPYLSIGGPEEGAILRAPPIRLQGESEPGAASVERRARCDRSRWRVRSALPAISRPEHGGDRGRGCGRQQDRTAADVHIHAGPAGGGGVRSGHPPPLRPALRDRSRGDLDRRPNRSECPRRDRGRRWRRARVVLCRPRGQVRRQRVPARARRGLCGPGGVAVRVRQPGRVPRHHRPGTAADRARGAAAAGHGRGVAAAARPACGRPASPDRRRAGRADRGDIR